VLIEFEFSTGDGVQREKKAKREVDMGQGTNDDGEAD
jgi:hypothetical protein